MISSVPASVFVSLGIFGHALAFFYASPLVFFGFVVFFCFAPAFFGASPTNH